MLIFVFVKNNCVLCALNNEENRTTEITGNQFRWQRP